MATASRLAKAKVNPNKGKKLSEVDKKQRALQKMINKYNREHRWLMWAAIIILILILLLLTTIGYAYNWGKNSDNARNDALKTLNTAGQTGSTGSSGATKTGSGTTTPPDTGLLNLAAQLSTGQPLNTALNTAANLGINSDCQVQLLIVKTCVFSEDGKSLTVKVLVGDGNISSIEANL